MEFEILVEVLAQSYQNSGRPSAFIVSNDKETINRVKRQGYEHVTWRNNSYVTSDAWREFTRIDAEGFAQWKSY